MKPIRFALGVIAIAFTTTAAAVPSSVYSFANPTSSSHTQSDTSAGWTNAPGTGSDGTNWGNSLTFTSTGLAVPVTVTAWASTGGSGGYGGTLQTAAVTRYGSNELAITSRTSVNGSGTSTGTSTSGNAGVATTANLAINAELSGWAPNTSSTSNQHAVDNAGAYESLMFSFASAVTLKDVSIGFPSSGSGLDSDATILVYTGTGDPTAALSTRTYAQLLTSGWQIAGNALDIAQQPGSHEALSTSLSSKYWMVGAYMAIGANTSTNLNDGKDFIKVNGLTAIRAVPEPSSLALFGIAGAALLAGRRRIVRKA